MEWCVKRRRMPCEIFEPEESFLGAIPSIFGSDLSAIFEESKAPVINGTDLRTVKQEIFRHSCNITSLQDLPIRLMKTKNTKRAQFMTPEISNYIQRVMREYYSKAQNPFCRLLESEQVKEKKAYWRNLQLSVTTFKDIYIRLGTQTFFPYLTFST